MIIDSVGDSKLACYGNMAKMLAMSALVVLVSLHILVRMVIRPPVL